MSLDHFYGDTNGAVIIDLSQIALATAAVAYGDEPGKKFTVPLVRQLILSTLKHNALKFKSEGYEKVIIAVDNARYGYWRRQEQDYYKRNRAISREENANQFDWEGYFNGLNEVVTELEQNMPYTLINVKHCEADDVIAVLTKHLSEMDWKVRIISSDGDFTQLHKYKNVDQYSPVQKKFVSIKTGSPAEDCLTKVLKGDRKDNVASIKVRGDFYLCDLGVRTPSTSASFINDMVGKSDDEIFEVFKDDVMTKLLAKKPGKKWIETELKTFLTEGVEELLENESTEALADMVIKQRIKYNLITLYGMDEDKVSGIIERNTIETLGELLAKIRMKRFIENRVLIDFDYIRTDIRENILEAYRTVVPAPRGKMYPYFVKSGLTKLIPEIANF